MTEFVFWKYAYVQEWATKEDIKSACTFGLITDAQMKMILGEVSALEDTYTN